MAPIKLEFRTKVWGSVFISLALVVPVWIWCRSWLEYVGTGLQAVALGFALVELNALDKTFGGPGFVARMGPRKMPTVTGMVNEFGASGNESATEQGTAHINVDLEGRVRLLEESVKVLQASNGQLRQALQEETQNRKRQVRDAEQRLTASVLGVESKLKESLGVDDLGTGYALLIFAVFGTLASLLS